MVPAPCSTSGRSQTQPDSASQQAWLSLSFFHWAGPFSRAQVCPGCVTFLSRRETGQKRGVPSRPDPLWNTRKRQPRGTSARRRKRCQWTIGKMQRAWHGHGTSVRSNAKSMGASCNAGRTDCGRTGSTGRSSRRSKRHSNWKLQRLDLFRALTDPLRPRLSPA